MCQNYSSELHMMRPRINIISTCMIQHGATNSKHVTGYQLSVIVGEFSVTDPGINEFVFMLIDVLVFMFTDQYVHVHSTKSLKRWTTSIDNRRNTWASIKQQIGWYLMSLFAGTLKCVDRMIWCLSIGWKSHWSYERHTHRIVCTTLFDWHDNNNFYTLLHQRTTAYMRWQQQMLPCLFTRI